MTTTALPAAALIAELQAEAEATRRLLAAVPADKLDWRPHEKSFTLGKLAAHVAEIPARLTTMLQQPEFDFAERTGLEQPGSLEEILSVHDEGLAAAQAALAGWSAEQLAAEWRAHNEGATLMAMPRAAVLRTILLNHWYHHRGQLSVYLRLLDVPLPSVYGPTADVNPFG